MDKVLLIINFFYRIVSTFYEREYGSSSRIIGFSKMLLFSPSSAMVACPFAMTDGVARISELFGPFEKNSSDVYERLTSRDPEFAWTSGQWMTERPGGSDVSNTETVATHDTDKHYKINGFKWFSSATDSQVCALLAKVEGDNNRLTCFLGDVDLSKVKINRLKKKFGTVAVPTAELELRDMNAEIVGPLGKGVATISTVLNITRIHSSFGSLSFMRRALHIAKQYSLVRKVFGRRLNEIPSHVSILATQEVLARGLLMLGCYACKLVGDQECHVPQTKHEHQQLLRVIPGVLKAISCKMAIGSISECMEALGGVGYLEHDVQFNIARLLRDAQVNPIWEGTTNTLASDFIRHVWKNGTAFTGAVDWFLDENLNNLPRPTSNHDHPDVSLSTSGVGQLSANNVNTLLADDEALLTELSNKIRGDWKVLQIELAERDEGTARQAIFEFGRIAIATMLIGSANRNRGQAEYLETAARWAVDDISAYTKKRNVNTFYSNYKKAINQCEYLFIYLFSFLKSLMTLSLVHLK